jgi:TolB-like protein
LWDPDRGAIGPLKDSGQKKDIFVLAFTGSNTLLSASKDLQVVTWDVAGKRALRRGTLQSAVRGRVVVPNTGAVDPTGDKLLLGAQLVAEQRGGALTGAGLARPSDLKRDNILMPYTVSTGFSGDAVNTTDYLAEHVALGPGACFAFFSSNYREQPRLHVWGLAQEGDDLARIDVMGKVSAVAVESAGHAVAVATETGRIRTWTVSGATPADCDAYMKKPSSVQVDAKISTGSETSPLIKGGAGTRVAVLRFDATGIDAGLGDAVAEMVAGELANSPQVTVIERSAIDKVLKEMEIQRSGLTASDAVKIGKGLNAKTVIFGGVRRFGDSTFVVTARSVDVETQQVQGSREVTCENCKEADLPRAVSALRRIIVP